MARTTALQGSSGILTIIQLHDNPNQPLSKEELDEFCNALVNVEHGGVLVTTIPHTVQIVDAPSGPEPEEEDDFDFDEGASSDFILDDDDYDMFNIPHGPEDDITGDVEDEPIIDAGGIELR